MRKHFATLGLAADASPAEIRQAYRKLCKMYHPDLHGGSTDYEERFKAINEAYQALKRPAPPREDTLFRRGRRAYDRWVTPDFAREQEEEQRNAPRRERPGFGPRAWFTLLLLAIVLALPFWLASPVADNASTEPAVLTMAGSPVPTTQTSAATAEERRFQRDLAEFKRIRKTDPSLQGLDLETGYYQGPGEQVKFSWAFVQYLKRRHLH